MEAANEYGKQFAESMISKYRPTMESSVPAPLAKKVPWDLMHAFIASIAAKVWEAGYLAALKQCREDFVSAAEETLKRASEERRLSENHDAL